jgi:hypothetical protein
MNSSDYENLYVPPCVLVPDKDLNSVANRYVKLNTLNDTQEYLSNGHRKITFGNDEDTVS